MPFQWKIHGLWLKVLDRDNVLRIQQNIVQNNYQLKRSGPPVKITSVSAYVNVSYFHVSGVSKYKNQF